MILAIIFCRGQVVKLTNVLSFIEFDSWIASKPRLQSQRRIRTNNARSPTSRAFTKQFDASSKLL